ncbi:hypothetical protein [Pectobacterium carotovorum]|uniref:Uncharacterized protein n=1 Tax=Pectobacterium carotovorum subsp. carotovorum TaxID=555 RepID=A0AAI9KWQ2_PECCC|nr:hypothetical protein [Pectobacterium carotovorum]GKX45538.1 hypothetical protein SOASR016_02900 [Pectobacterium carotovorum subsp. carotovorum]GLV67846.1 hypothetical protein Pcaca03_02900 [Pectobacterium carotovorum subsp. carotovorum]
MMNRQDRCLLSVIEKLGELEWKRYRERYPEIWNNDHFERADCSNIPPSTSFRFKEENLHVINLLKEALDSYKGRLQWSMIDQPKKYTEGVNRCIMPTYVKELREKKDETFEVYDYISEHLPEFGLIAYEDLVGLADHVRLAFKNAGYDV